MKATAHLELIGVTRQFGRIRAVDDISVQLPSKGVVALVGPNGAGKSTLLDILSGNLRASAGKVDFSSMDRTLTMASRRRFFSHLHQRLVVPGGLTAAEYLCLAREPVAQLSAQRMLSRNWCQLSDSSDHYLEWLWSLLSAADLVGKLDTPMSRLSFGQQRIVALAAVLLSPSHFGSLLDEPFAGLAEKAKIAARAAISHYADSQLTILVEHDLDTVREIADIMLVLVAGELLDIHTGKDVRNADLMPHFLGNTI